MCHGAVHFTLPPTTRRRTYWIKFFQYKNSDKNTFQWLFYHMYFWIIISLLELVIDLNSF